MRRSRSPIVPQPFLLRSFQASIMPLVALSAVLAVFRQLAKVEAEAGSATPPESAAAPAAPAAQPSGLMILSYLFQICAAALAPVVQLLAATTDDEANRPIIRASPKYCLRFLFCISIPPVIDLRCCIRKVA